MEFDARSAYRAAVAQGLAGRRLASSPAAVLERYGWARTVGSSNPYLGLFARAGVRRAEADSAAARRDVAETPAARSCTYLVPSCDWGLALALAAGKAAIDLGRARKAGAEPGEAERLADAVREALQDGLLNPAELKARLGSQVRSLGEAGKKQGLSTTLPVALAILQEQGAVRRVPVDGRLDHERYRYEATEPPALPSRAEGLSRLADRYFRWTGGATMEQFRWFAGAGAREATLAVEGLGLVEEGGLLVPPGLVPTEVPDSPDVRFVAALDGLFHYRRSVAPHLDADGAARLDALGLASGPGRLADLDSNAVVDRGVLVGLWEYDADEGRVVWHSWSPHRAAVADAAAEVEEFVRSDLGDCRTFSLDSPKSRQTRLDALRRAGSGV